MNTQLKRSALACAAALGLASAGASFAQSTAPVNDGFSPAPAPPGYLERLAQASEPQPSTTAIVTPPDRTTVHVEPAPAAAVISPRVSVKGTRSSTQLIPQWVAGTPSNIRASPFDPLLLEGSLKVATYSDALGNPQPPPVPFNLDTGYLGAPLIESRSGE